VENYFFMLKDNPTDPDWLPGDGCDESDGLCLDALLPIGADDPEKSDLASHKGWYLELEAGEKVVTSAITVYGTATFSTHTPADPEPGSCASNLGIANVYNVGYANAKSRNGTDNRFEVVSGGGLPPSPVAGLVLITMPGGRHRETDTVHHRRRSGLPSAEPRPIGAILRPSSPRA
jgi:type IV pilus assembly protein PilY1